MPKKFLRRYLPSPAKLREHPALRPLGNVLQDPGIWHLHRRSVSGAFFIGLFCAFLPVPFQMLIAGALAVVSRCNLAISVVLVWITNPITLPPMFYFAYRLGAWLLGTDLQLGEGDLSWAWLADNLHTISVPLIFGCLVCGWVSGISAFIIVRITWRMRVARKWRERRRQRQSSTEIKVREVLQSDLLPTPAAQAESRQTNK